MIPSAPPPAFGMHQGPPLVSFVTNATENSTVVSHTLASVNVSDAQKRPRIVVVCTQSNASVSITGTIGGVAATVATNENTTNLTRAIMWRRINPTDTTLNIVCTNSGATGSQHYTAVFMIYTSDLTAPTAVAQSAVAATAVAIPKNVAIVCMTTIFANGGVTGAPSTAPLLTSAHIQAGTWSTYTSFGRSFEVYASTTVGRPGLTPATQPRTQYIYFK